jgi:c-di-GMP-specific phosphodiesterase
VIEQVPTAFLTDEHTNADALALWHRKLWGTEGFHIDLLARDKKGKNLWVSSTVSPILDDDALVRNVVVFLVDVTANRQIEMLRRDMLEKLAGGMALKDAGDFLCLQVEQMTPDIVVSILLVDAEGRLRPLSGPSLPARYCAALDGIKIGPDVGSCGTAAFLGGPVVARDIATDPLWGPYRYLGLPDDLLACWSSPIKRRNGEVAGTFAFYFRERRGPDAWHEQVVNACVHLCMLAIEHSEAKGQIARLLHFDPLTGLPNKARFEQDMADRLPKESRSTAFFFVDLDRFRDINEVHGHSAGDLLLIEAANRLRSFLLHGETAYRFSGDEFLVVLPNTDVPAASRRAQQLLETFAGRIVISGGALVPSVSIGISLFPDDGENAETLLKRAGAALSQVKTDGRGSYRFFSPRMNRIAQDRLMICSALRAALANEALQLHYQPQVVTSTLAPYGVEALMRWTDPVLGQVPPARFIPIAEDLGLINRLGCWSLRHACQQMTEWREAGIVVPAISVNISPLHFCDPQFPDFIAGLLAEFRLPPANLTLEITEGVMIHGEKRARDIILAVREIGVRLSMDDFGTGFSSLSALYDLPISELKIDRSFMRNVDKDSRALALVTTVVRIGQSLGLSVVAEGVETKAQHQVLVDLGCQAAQGYLFSRPLPAPKLVEWISKHGRVPADRPVV